jgi:hypothetical protein
MRSYGCDRSFPYLKVGGTRRIAEVPGERSLLARLAIAYSLSLFPPANIVLLFLEIIPRDEVAIQPYLS